MATGGELLMQAILAQGGRIGFGVPGESYLAVLDAMHGSDFRFVNARHEGGAAFMAEAWAKLTGEVGLCFVTRGPGATNASIGVHSAMQASTPMILFVGQISTSWREREAFQELDYRAVFGTMAKWVTELDDPARIPEIIARAWRIAQSGRPGPVVIALPEDMLSTDLPDTVAPARAVEIVRPAPAPEQIDQTRAALTDAKRPLILAGGGGWRPEGKAALQKLAEGSGIPVVCAFRNQDLFDNDSPLYAGDAGVGMTHATKTLLRKADVILALGPRFGEMTTDGYTLFNMPEPEQMLIHAHADSSEIGKILQPHIALHADPGAVAAHLTQNPSRGVWSGWAKAARAGVTDLITTPAQPSPVDMVAVCAHLREVLSDDAILTNGAGNFGVWPSRYIPVGGARRLLAPQSGAMGYGIPAAIAASIEEPGREVICFAGDGDFQMTGMELATAAQTGATPIILVLANRSYGTIRMHQERHFPARVSGTDLENPDFTALARACGLHGAKVARTEAFADAFAAARASRTAAVLELDIAIEALTPTATLSDIRGQS
ncbi:thiamine pyrophosphate-dependent enzyme [Pontivivens insulae]|uniref:Acetolactate synthase isozyme 2 large subunit n=1 Tax=Pontivivens insulae TaxID=1639689 RepID=A0A2R8ABF8_9RHOB|nr:thiamine pyrophosphate-dependent enzyme [Pontivivens insulae]RED11280.1 acetolactate synthase-1/2/3 large subunit [Pontivivens insulae]SPF29547.1 Acetolactate synthase isozyme 2 large subunit [Pontivivens insulae]